MRYKGIKGKCWELIKQICRLRSKNCYTCPARNITSYNAQAGHCWPVGLVGSNNTLSWDLKQIRLQCGHCNGVGQGMQVIFKRNLERELGRKVVSELEKRVYRTDPVRSWEELYKYLQNELTKLQNHANLED